MFVRLRVEMQPASLLTVFELKQRIVLPCTQRGARLPPTHMNYCLCAEIRENKRGEWTRYNPRNTTNNNGSRATRVWCLNFLFRENPFCISIYDQLNANVETPKYSRHFGRTSCAVARDLGSCCASRCRPIWTLKLLSTHEALIRWVEALSECGAFDHYLL